MFSLLQPEIATRRRQAMLDDAAAARQVRQARRTAAAPVSAAKTPTASRFGLVPRYLRYAAASLASIAFGFTGN